MLKILLKWVMEKEKRSANGEKKCQSESYRLDDKNDNLYSYILRLLSMS